MKTDEKAASIQGTLSSNRRGQKKIDKAGKRGSRNI